VNSKTENWKMFEGSSQARKGKITADEGSLTSYFNQQEISIVSEGKRNDFYV